MEEMGDRGGWVTRDAVSVIEIEVAGYCFINAFIISYLMIFILFICCFFGFYPSSIVICSHCFCLLTMHYLTNHFLELSATLATSFSSSSQSSYSSSIHSHI